MGAERTFLPSALVYWASPALWRAEPLLAAHTARPQAPGQLSVSHEFCFKYKSGELD